MVAGPSADTGTFQLFNWSGRAADKSRALSVPLSDLRPEALFVWPNGNLTLLSDDGGIFVNGVECKDLPDATALGLRALMIDLPR